MGLIWGAIYPDRKSQKKGATRIAVRIIEYTIDADRKPTTYRLITSLMDIALFPALLLAAEYHQRSRNRKHDWRTQDSSQWAHSSHSLSQTSWSCPRNLWLASRTLCSTANNVHCGTASWNISSAFGLYWHFKSDSTGNSRLPGYTKRTTAFFFSKLIIDILKETIPSRQSRSNPRVVKKPRSKFPSKKPRHRSAGVKRQPLTFSISNTT